MKIVDKECEDSCRKIKYLYIKLASSIPIVMYVSSLHVVALLLSDEAEKEAEVGVRVIPLAPSD